MNPSEEHRQPEPANSTPEGLTFEAASALLEQIGPNELPAVPPTRLWRRVVAQFRNAIIAILLIALVFDLAVWLLEGATKWPFEAIAIAVILAFNTVMGVWQEYRAEDALTRLKAMAAPQAWVRRDDEMHRVPAAAVVPGDVVRLGAGDRIPADAQVLDQSALLVDESMLTGESVPVERAVGEQVLSGTLAVRGQAWLWVTRTGASSAMGQIAGMLGAVADERTPLERRLQRFGHRVARAIALLAVVLMVVGISVEGLDRFGEVLLFSVAVAVAAVPEGLPAVMTLTLALGTERMSARRAVVRRLAAVEALGSVTVIATDKTGTLTENEMRVARLDTTDEVRALRAMVLAADAEPDASTGDPLELGLYRYAATRGVDPVETREAYPAVALRPFDAEWRHMRVTVVEEGNRVAYLKGAAEVLLEMSNLNANERRRWTARVQAAAETGHRVLGLAWSPTDDESDAVKWLGIVWLWDPPRAEVPDAVASAKRAGIRVVIITGDHPATATAVAARIGIDDPHAVTGDEIAGLDDEELLEVATRADVFARFTPEYKLDLVDRLMDSGEVVAMTGDGVNDAPALKRADVGVAMGVRGSDVTREVADLVLLDDNFVTIAAAVEEGRSIYDNIQKFLRFLFSTNVALVLLVAIGVIGAAVLDLRDEAGDLLVPLTAAQLLWINVIADGPPALALGLDRNPGVMRRAPRPTTAPLLTSPALRFILGTGILKAALGLGLFFTLPELGYSGTETRTAVFLYESLAQVAFVYPARTLGGRSAPNRVLDTIVAATIVLQLLTVTTPGLRSLLDLAPLDNRAWGLVGVSLAVSVAGAWISALATREIPATRVTTTDPNPRPR